MVAHRETALAALFPSDGDSSPSALRRWRDKNAEQRPDRARAGAHHARQQDEQQQTVA